MTEPTAQERLAALQARRQTSHPKPIQPALDTDVTRVLGSTEPDLAAPSAPRPIAVPWSRIAAGGASVVSFASMVVAMGPLLKSIDTTQVEAAQIGDDSPVPDDGTATPGAPPVNIDVNPPAPQPLTVNGGIQTAQDPTTPDAVLPDATATEPDTAAAPPPADTQAELADQTPQAQPPITAPPETQPLETQPPTTAPPATAPPETQPPATQPPATEPPITAPPETQPPATQPPATAPPTTTPPTAPPTTPPPRSDGSGG